MMRFQPASQFFAFSRKCLLLICGVVLPLCLLGGITTYFAHAKADLQQNPFSCTTVSEVSFNECLALVSLYEAAGGPGWITQTNWLVSNTPCGWYGVTCRSGTVVGLILNKNQLSGTLSTAVGDLLNLEELFLANNQLGGPLSTAIVQLPALTRLSLPNNRFTGELPSSFVNETGLTLINLRGNQFSGRIPDSFQHLQSLESLQLGGTYTVDGSGRAAITGELPSWLPLLSSLRVLEIVSAEITGSIPSNLSLLTNLETLDLSQNNLSGPIPEIFDSLPVFTSLNLAINQLTGPLPRSLLNSTMLTQLHVSNNRLSGPIPDAIGNLENLSYFALSQNDFAGPIPQSITTVGRQYLSQPGRQFMIFTIENNRLITDNLEVDIFLNQHNPTWAESQKSPIYLQLIDDSNRFLSTTPVQLYINGTKVITTTDAQGRVGSEQILFNLNDQIDILVEQYEAPSPKAQHDGWIYRVYLSTFTPTTTGELARYTIQNYGAQPIRLSRDNPLILLNLVVSVDRKLYDQQDITAGHTPEYLNNLRDAFVSASDFLFAVTDGQFALGQVTIYEGGREWEHADIQFLSDNKLRPNAEVGGLFAADTHIYLGKHWDRHGHWSQQPDDDREWRDGDGFRTIVHELGHYVLRLYDSYEDTKSGKPIYKCDSIMGNHYVASTITTTNAIDVQAFILSMQGLNPWTVGNGSAMPIPDGETQKDCTQTYQWKYNKESDWETVHRFFTDITASTRWAIRTPKSIGYHMVGPGQLPIEFPLVQMIVPSTTLTSVPSVLIDKAQFTVTSTSPADVKTAVHVYVVRAGTDGAITYLGPVDADGQMTATDLQPDDRVVLVATDGSQIVSARAEDAGAIVLDVAKWHPVVSHKIFEDWSGFALTVSELDATIDVNTLHVYVVEAGGKPIPVQMETQMVSDTLHATVNFPARPIKNGNILLTVQSTTQPSETFDYLTNFAIRDWPGSHMTQDAPIDLDSMDGNFHLSIPISAIDTSNLSTESIRVMVMPIQPTTSGSATLTQQQENVVTGAQLNPDSNSLPLEPGLTQIGSLYNVRASHGITKLLSPALLTLYFSPAAIDEWVGKGFKKEALHIYYRDEREGAWIDRGGEFQETVNGQSISTPIDHFGIYGIMIRTGYVLTNGQNAFTYPRLAQEVPAALASCSGQYSAVYHETTTSQWRKYVVGAPGYVNNLAQLQPNETYQIMVEPHCELQFLPTAQNATAWTEQTTVGTIPVKQSLPSLPAGFYGTVSTADEKIWVCRETNECAETPVNDWNNQRVYTIDLPTDNDRTTFAVTIRTPSGHEVQAIAEAGVTKEISIKAAPEITDILYIPLIRR